MSGYSRPPQGGRPVGSQRSGNQQTIPSPLPITYFENGLLKPHLLDEEALVVAESLVSESLGRNKMKASQLRRFYDDVLSLRRRLDLESGTDLTQRERSFSAIRAEFKMLKAKAVYAWGRDQGKTFPLPMLQFVINHVHAVKSARDFDAFCKHFQAVVAYHKFYVKE